MKDRTQIIIAGVEEGREHYISSAKSTPKKTWVWWTDSKDDAYDFGTVGKARRALSHMGLPIPCIVVVRHCFE